MKINTVHYTYYNVYIYCERKLQRKVPVDQCDQIMSSPINSCNHISIKYKKKYTAHEKCEIHWKVFVQIKVHVKHLFMHLILIIRITLLFRSNTCAFEFNPN